ncbi:MAG: M1 family aminopeptidase, partial [Planctomycetota bacterium]
MKKLCLLLILLAQVLADSGDKLYGRNIDVYSRTLQTERSREFDAVHYRIRLKFDEDKGMFWGETTITLRPLSDNFEKCSFDAEKFTVSAVKDQSGQPLEFHQGDGKIAVRLGQKCDYGDELSVTVQYSAEDC